MKLTITYKGSDASDLGYLLHKNPARPQTVELSYGKAHIFYPEAGAQVCTAVLLLDINPVDLARGRPGKGRDDGLFDYVNDRPYVASSFLSTAIAEAYGTAMSGRCRLRPEMAAARLPLTASVDMLPCRDGEETLRKLFEPLGYAVRVEGFPLDERFPEWGRSRYYNLCLGGEVRLCDLLSHLYVLIPVLDSAKHYWIGEAEIEKLLRHGEGWLAAHPMKEYVAVRYLKRSRRLVKEALLRLAEAEDAVIDGGDEEKKAERSIEEREFRLDLNRQRMGTVVATLKNSGASRVLDLGCGEGRLLSLLRKERQFTEILGMDVSGIVLERAAHRLRLERAADEEQERLRLIQSSFLYRDKRLAGYDACAAVEVVEHIDPSRLAFFEKNVFGHIRCKTIVLTTPNKEYNDNYVFARGVLRHEDHRFEWTRAEFRDWALRVADRYGYAVRFAGIGNADASQGTPTQMAVFARCFNPHPTLSAE